MFNKKGQITIFVILGIVAIIAVFFALQLSRSNVERPTLDPASFNNFESYADSCFSQAAAKSLEDILNDNFGVYYDRDVYETDNSIQIPYLLNYNRAFFISVDEVELMLNAFVDYNSRDCLNVDVQDALGLESLIVNDLNVDVQIREEDILISHELNATVSVDGAEVKEFWDFSSRLDYPLPSFVSVVNTFAFYQQTADGFLIGRLSQLAYDNDFRYEYEYVDDLMLVSFYFPDVADVFINDYTRSTFAFKGSFSEVNT